MNTGPQLQPVVILPAVQSVAASDLRRAFGVTKQAMSLWRLKYGFPGPSYRRGRNTFTTTSDVAAFVAAHGSTVRWI